MELTQQLHQINTLLAEIDAAYHQAAVRLHIADSALAVLYILRDAGDGCPLRTVYRQYGMSKQTVNSALRKLEEDGCLFLEPGPGRSKTLHLTATGKQRVEGTAGRLQAAERRVFERWTPEDRAAYVRLLKKYRTDFQQELQGL
ncbi:MAG: winged helix DNA-binding protein [Succiniclasticum sp.]|jgi:DNA-binding MarR family transcriptional regulator|nr:winged helix DNA-binding protein [Succiniclasticum sp.]MDY2869994.1 winged helix DNA-binding protein [Succiniclasticum sp.]MDY6303733.1 winged helix DNA-binding protein [Succiniclasticum sp.]MDY6345877.1 winged helix DNA-binding protein [Succiniclasticum sp.]